MNLETLDDMWQKDAILDDEKLDHDSLAIPKLHAKYLRIYNSFVSLRDQQELTVKSVYRDRWEYYTCLLYTSPSPRDRQKSRMPSSA